MFPPFVQHFSNIFTPKNAPVGPGRWTGTALGGASTLRDPQLAAAAAGDGTDTPGTLRGVRVCGERCLVKGEKHGKKRGQPFLGVFGTYRFLTILN